MGMWEYGKRAPWRTCWEPAPLAEIGEFEHYVVGVSGGADSTAALLWVLERVPKERVRAVHYVTGAEWPEALEYLGYLESELDLEIRMLSNGVDFLEMLHWFGRWPNARNRWCTRLLKQEVYLPYVWGLHAPLVVVGSRRGESRARERLPFFTTKVRHGATRGNVPTLYPLVTWSHGDVVGFIQEHGLKSNRVYQYVDRVSCWCCVMGRFADLVTFCRLHPEVAEPFAEFERGTGYRWRDRGGSVVQALEEAQTGSKPGLIRVHPG